MRGWKRRNDIDDEWEKQFERTLAYGIYGLGINEVSKENTAETRLKNDITESND